jgi:hypothetical protein
MKLELPDITLCVVDCLNINLAIKVIEQCKSKVDFGEVLLLTSIPTDYVHAVRIKPLNSLVPYSIFMLKELHKYINTNQVQICQRDGWILNPESWDDSWKSLDFIGPIYMQNDFVGSGGFSLRSKKIMEAVSKTLPEWDGTQKGADEIQKGLQFYEDGQLTLTEFAKDFKIATLEQAADYAQGGNRNPLYFRTKSYGFHRTWQTIKFDTGYIDSSDTSKHIHVSYDHEIEQL